ncbi:hypothetical protein [Roseomonas indoligenes]|uniref:Uncharacterized protein n=1 Tax=Roseomonas indoligenes TaxID=2820811 RepID=A0A940N3Q2_9PROT|nr:hypothetical protein [Pararoseomonas indoligenes]MBP0493642.1 hypothetical protein [Pararoseomonas indoligenes]
MPAPRRYPLPVRLLAVLAVILIAGLPWYLDRLTHPWGNPFSAEGTLTGDWAGTATTPTGRPLRIWLQLRMSTRNSGCRSGTGCGPYPTGQAATCDERGTLRLYRITASVPDNDESRIRFSPTPPPEVAQEVHLGPLTGSRTGDTLRLQGRLFAPGPVTTRMWTDENGIDRSSIRAGHPDAEAITTWTLNRYAGPWPRNCPPS